MMITYVATKSRRPRRILFQKKTFVLFVTSWLRTLIVIAACQCALQAHSGPPFPIVTDKAVGAYTVSVWTDPDATDDQSAAGRFWVTLKPAADDVRVSIKPTDRAGAERSGLAEAVNGDKQRQFVVLLLDHEGPYAVHVAISGTRGAAEVDATADATYDLRPRPALIVLFVMPFVLIGFLWGKLLMKRRIHKRGGQ